MGRLKTSKSWVALTILATFAVSCSSFTRNSFNTDLENDIKTRKRNTSHVGEGDGIHLSEAIQKNLKTDAISEERLPVLKFIASVNRGKKKKGHNYFQECANKFHDARECVFLKDSWSLSWFSDDEEDEDDTEIALISTPAPQSKASKKKHARVVDQLVSQIKAGTIDPVSEQWEGDYYRAFKKFKQWSPELEQLAKKLIETETCASSEAYNYLGLKAEEFFPSPELLKSAMALYAKADSCATANASYGNSRYVQNSRFRLGLLSILDNNCGQAQKVFTRLAKMGQGDFTTRSLYWSAYCAKNDAKKEEFFTNFDELFRTNPLGFHTLSMTNGNSPLIENLSKPIDPIIKKRTSSEQHNFWLSVIEDMDQLGESSSVQKLLSPIRKNPDYLLQLEPGVRLYLSTFAFRAKDTMSLFRILDSVFRTQSEYIVDSTLKLFYPVKYLGLIAGTVRRVNPFLITALIRQESAFQEAAHSRVGATGLMQLMPRTAKLMDRSSTKQKLYSPEFNIRLGIAYFEGLVDRFHGDVELALASYNAGPEVVDRWAKRYPMKNRLLFLDLIPYSETRNYVTLIGRNYYWYSKLYSDQLEKETGFAQFNTRSEFQSLKADVLPAESQ